MSAARSDAVAEVGGEREAVGDDRDRLGRATACRSAILSLILPSSVTPPRSSRKIVTTRRISSSAGRLGGQLERAPDLGHPLRDDLDLLLGLSGSGRTTVLKRRLSALRQLVDALVAVVGGGDDVEARAPAPRCSSSGIGSVFSDRMVISVSCTSVGMRVSSSTRAILPASIARIIGLGTSACSGGPSASSRA